MFPQGKYKTIYIDPPWPEHGGGKIKRGADRHYALMQETVPGISEGIVTEELQRGYLLSGQLLRAAKVKISC